MRKRPGDVIGWRRAGGVFLGLSTLAGALGCDGNMPRGAVAAAAPEPPAAAAPLAAAAPGAKCNCPQAPPCQGGPTKAAEQPQTIEFVDAVEVGRSPARGPEGAPLTLVLFSDFECPFCARIEPTLAALEAAYPGKIRFVWKNFPLEFHKRARPAAQAAFAAGEQGKFWQMRARLLESQGQLGPEDLERYAGELGLDLARFRASLASPASADAVEADVRQGRALGVSGTPVLFINRRKLVGAQPLPAMKAAVDEELARVAGGTR